MGTSPVAVLRTVETTTAWVHIRADDIYHVEFKPDAYVDLEQQNENRELFIQLTGGEKKLFIYTGQEGVQITREARENAKQLEAETPMIAVAVVTKNLAYRLLADFYGKFHKTHIPYKVFSEMKDAEKWLNSFRK